MVYCSKCGAKVGEEMAFCPFCGAPLKSAKVEAEAPVPMPWKAEKGEKEEKAEKAEKQEKAEKRELGIIGPLMGGLILICIGFIAYLQIIGVFEARLAGAIFLIILGVIIIIAGVYAYVTAARRHPKV
ncbi:zinc ribbon domain-containing protein [Candidatus Bathyarchaeota archaeon]|nr:zinc ribbon domain-containing protein [Candidatus Bathyarchaeota archaeon]MBS7627887.1 zinc ribbon domain-containing protein [Candidatus Bathyarchaeota archaeon]